MRLAIIKIILGLVVGTFAAIGVQATFKPFVVQKARAAGHYTKNERANLQQFVQRYVVKHPRRK